MPEKTPTMPNRLYIPHGPAQLMAVSPELQLNEGAWYVLEDVDEGPPSAKARRAAEDCEGLITCLLTDEEKENTRRLFAALIHRRFGGEDGDPR